MPLVPEDERKTGPGRWGIAGVTAAVLFLGAIFLFVSMPVTRMQVHFGTWHVYAGTDKPNWPRLAPGFTSERDGAFLSLRIGSYQWIAYRIP